MGRPLVFASRKRQSKNPKHEQAGTPKHRRCHLGRRGIFGVYMVHGLSLGGVHLGIARYKNGNQ